ncbi:MAG: type II toxin-antitoxin system VapC family toxin [Bryobacteraceae bacterium]
MPLYLAGAAHPNKTEAQMAMRALMDMVDDVLAIERRDGLRAAEMVPGHDWLSARDAIHIAVMERHEVTSILSFDSDFDRWPGLRRISRA